MKTWHYQLWAIAVGVTLATVAYGQFPDYPQPNLPALEACQNPLPQPLPVQWEATTLMAPYLYSGDPFDFSDLPSRASLVVGKFVYNAEETLMRVTQVSVSLPERLDSLITSGSTYVLGGDFSDPECVGEFETTYQVPARVLQSGTATCVGSHPTAPNLDGLAVDWWKQESPITDPGAQGLAADWYWFDANGYPTRTMFWDKHDGLPAILGDYAYTNFYEFAPGNSIDLKAIYDRCAAQQPLPMIEKAEPPNLQSQQTTADIEPSDLIPGLSFSGCQELNAQPPSFPVSFYATSFSTAAKFGTPKPFPTSVHYQPDAPLGPGIRTRLNKEVVWSDALLVQDSSYGVDTLLVPPLNQRGCGAGPHTSLPGAPQSQWGPRGIASVLALSKTIPCSAPIGTRK
jgi:hypothetical protein